MNTQLIEKFASVLCDPRPPEVRDPRPLIDSNGDMKIYYAPFEYTNPSARIVLVGITPGPTQMVNANNEARRALKPAPTGKPMICHRRRACRLAGVCSGQGFDKSPDREYT